MWEICKEKDIYVLEEVSWGCSFNERHVFAIDILRFRIDENMYVKIVEFAITGHRKSDINQG